VVSSSLVSGVHSVGDVNVVVVVGGGVLYVCGDEVVGDGGGDVGLYPGGRKRNAGVIVVSSGEGRCCWRRDGMSPVSLLFTGETGTFGETVEFERDTSAVISLLFCAILQPVARACGHGVVHIVFRWPQP
jgi:hypothetical protein